MLTALVMVLALAGVTSEPDPAIVGTAGFGLAYDVEAGRTWFCTAVLIRPDAALVAKHCVDSLAGQQGALRFSIPFPGSEVDFYSVRIGHFAYTEPGTQVYVAYLVEAVSHIQPIPPSFTLPTIDDPPVLLAGWGRTGVVFGEGPLEFCQCDTYLTYAGAELQNWLSYWAGGLCGPNSGDSGGPVLRERQGDRQGYEVIGLIQYAGGGTSLARYVNDPNYNGGVE